MASTITAGNATNGMAITPDSTGILELKTGTGAGTTALTLNASQNATLAGTLQVAGVTTNMYPIVSGTAVTASGTSVTFAVPAWVKRITVMVQGLSFAGASGVARVQIGTAGSLTASGYTTEFLVVTGSNTCSVSSVTNGIAVFNGNLAGGALWGVATITKITGNTWISTYNSARSDTDAGRTGTGYIALAGALDIVGIAATSGTFDAGTINILYE